MFLTPQIRLIRCLRLESNQIVGNGLKRSRPLSRNLHRYHCTVSSGVCEAKLTLPLPATRVRNTFVKSFTSAVPESKCWNCHKDLEILKFSCLNCGVLQHPDPNMTYFELLDIPIVFDVDNETMASKYKSLQMMFHPDKYVRRSQEEMDISDVYSKLVNKAYSTLKNPLQRGMYILSLNGMKTDDESLQVDQEFLMDVMERNEQLEDIQDAESLMKMMRSNMKIIVELESLVSRAFRAKDLNAAREALTKMKYFVNIESEIKKKKMSLGLFD